MAWSSEPRSCSAGDDCCVLPNFEEDVVFSGGRPYAPPPDSSGSTTSDGASVFNIIDGGSVVVGANGILQVGAALQ